MQIRPVHLERDLADVGERIARAQEILRITREQLAYQSDLLEDAKTRMLVSETPLADREYRITRGDYDRLARARDRILAEVAELRAEQDRLLDRMLG